MRELLCQLCDKDYPVWFAPNDIWNSVMRDKGGKEETPFVCPTCFGIEYEQKYGTHIWEFRITHKQNTANDSVEYSLKKQRKCQYCNKDIFPRLADVRRGWGKFCNKSCKAKEQEQRTGQFKAILCHEEDPYDNVM